MIKPRVRLSPEVCRAGAAGPWAVEIDLGPKGLEAGGALKLIWMDSHHFADSSKMRPEEPEHDISVSCPGNVRFAVEHHWLPRCQDGQVVICRAQESVAPGSTVTITFGTYGKWKLGPFLFSYRLRVYEDVTGDGLFYIIHEDHALRCTADAPKRLTATLGPPDSEDQIPLFVNLWDDFNNPAPTTAIAHIIIPTLAPLEITLDKHAASTEVHLPTTDTHPLVCHVDVPQLGLGADSNPAPRLPDSSVRIYFGDIHCHTTLSDGMGSLEDLYTYARDVQRLDFASATDHESHFYGYSLAPEMWPLVREAAQRHYDPGHFVTLLGYEWTAASRKAISGHHNVYYRDTDGPFFTYSNPTTNSLKKLLKALRDLGRPVLVIPHHPVACKSAAGMPAPSLTVAWSVNDPQIIRLAEIYSKWGCSEEVPPTFRPLHNSAEGHAVRDALDKGYRLGFTAGSDDHTAMPGSLHVQGGRNLRYPNSGLVAVYAPELTREAIFDALYQRRCYATSGPRIVLDFSVNGHTMGQEITADNASDTRRIEGIAIGTAAVQSAEIVSSGRVHWTIPGNGSRELSFELEDTARLTEPMYYYVRIIQADGERAWSSPIWVDPPQR